MPQEITRSPDCGCHFRLPVHFARYSCCECDGNRSRLFKVTRRYRTLHHLERRSFLSTLIRYFGLRSVAILALVASFTAHAQDVKVMSSGAFAAAYKLLAPQYEKVSGAHLEIALGPSMGTTHDAI